MNYKRIVSLLTACALCLSLAACQPEGSPPSAPQPTVPVSSAAEATPAPTDTPAPSPEATPAATPVLTPGTDFSWLFANANPIEKAFREELELANNQTDLLQADITAIERYRRLINIAYEECLALLSPEDQEALKAEQAQWETDTEAEIEELTDGAEDSDEWKRSAASDIYELYWRRAHDLCEKKFDLDGVMPPIEDAMEEAAPVG